MSQPVQVDVVKPSRPAVQRRKSKEGKGEIDYIQIPSLILTCMKH